jgi:DNA-binding NtrC family response regulator
MPGMPGMEVLRLVKSRTPETEVIVMTGYGTIETAVDAMKAGAYEYILKPFPNETVVLLLQRIARQRKMVAENRALREQLGLASRLEGIIGQSREMREVFDRIKLVAPGEARVLMTGESGTGKSLIARAIHAHSGRRGGPFVEVSCGALPETLLESELFGHMRGAFTSAVADKPGKFAAADGGTIFLDEISTASPALQVKLLRVLQERQFEPVGSNETRTVDVRVVLATNQDLTAEVEAGRFRQDLYYRINVVNIELPPLRERPGDIPLLAQHFLRKFVAESGKAAVGLDEEVVRLMEQHPWPGNVRELENCMERAVLLCRGGLVQPSDLPAALLRPVSAVVAVSSQPMSLEDALAEPERQIIEAALARNGENRQATADELQINRTTLYKKMKKYGLLD